MKLLAIDPGNEKSAFVFYDRDEGKPTYFGKSPNPEVLQMLRSANVDQLAVEMVQSFGMPVGREVFETVLWIGRYIERFPGPHVLIYRSHIKATLCGSVRAKDGNIRQVLIDRYGGSKRAAIGLKKSPGPLYGFAGDCWSALAVAIVAAQNGSTQT